MQAIQEYVVTEFKHYGVGHNGNPPGRGSGAHPYGSGKRPYQDIEGTAKYDKLMKNRNASSGSSREDYVKRVKQSREPSRPEQKAFKAAFSKSDRPILGAGDKAYHKGGKPYTDEEIRQAKGDRSYEKSDKSDSNNDSQKRNYEQAKSDVVKQLEDRVKQLETEKATLEKKSEKKGLKKLFGKKEDKEDNTVQKKTRKELMEMSSDELQSYINKLRNVENALNMQSPVRKYLSKYGGEMATALAKDVALPTMTRMIKQGIYKQLKDSNDKKADDQKLSDKDLRYLAGLGGDKQKNHGGGGQSDKPKGDNAPNDNGKKEEGNKNKGKDNNKKH